MVLIICEHWNLRLHFFIISVFQIITLDYFLCLMPWVIMKTYESSLLEYLNPFRLWDIHDTDAFSL